MGRNWVIKMGVPIIIGVCQQSSSDAPITFSINQITGTTVNYGTTTLNVVAIPGAQVIAYTLDSSNGFSWEANTLCTLYNPENPIQVNHSFSPNIDASSITDAVLPADGSCSVTYTFQFDNGRYPVRIYDLVTGGFVNGGTTPVSLIFNSLNKADINGGGSETALPRILGGGNNNSLVTPSPGDFAQPSLNLTIGILLADTTTITTTQNLNTTGESIIPFVTEG